MQTIKKVFYLILLLISFQLEAQKIYGVEITYFAPLNFTTSTEKGGAFAGDYSNTLEKSYAFRLGLVKEKNQNKLQTLFFGFNKTVLVEEKNKNLDSIYVVADNERIFEWYYELGYGFGRTYYLQGSPFKIKIVNNFLMGASSYKSEYNSTSTINGIAGNTYYSKFTQPTFYSLAYMLQVGLLWHKGRWAIGPNISFDARVTFWDGEYTLERTRANPLSGSTTNSTSVDKSKTIFFKITPSLLFTASFNFYSKKKKE